LGQLGKHAASGFEEIADYLNDDTVNVRAMSCEALGIIGSTMEAIPDGVLQRLAHMLSDEEGKVRFQAALSLAQFGKKAENTVPQLIQALSDCNRYVQGYTIIALQRIGTPQALESLINFLVASRWCPLTTSEVPF